MVVDKLSDDGIVADTRVEVLQGRPVSIEELDGDDLKGPIKFLGHQWSPSDS